MADVAQPYVTGTVNFYVASSPGSPTPIYLGSTKGRPRIRFLPSFEDVDNDIGGDVPYDYKYGGSVAVVQARFSRIKISVLNAITSRPKMSLTAQRGTDVPGDLGTLMMTEGYTYALWLHFPYTGLKPTYGNQEYGYFFPAAFLRGPDDYDDLGTVARTTGLLWQCARYPYVSVNGVSWQLYNTLPANFSGLPIPV